MTEVISWRHTHMPSYDSPSHANRGPEWSALPTVKWDNVAPLVNRFFNTLLTRSAWRGYLDGVNSVASVQYKICQNFSDTEIESLASLLNTSAEQYAFTWAEEGIGRYAPLQFKVAQHQHQQYDRMGYQAYGEGHRGLASTYRKNLFFFRHFDIMESIEHRADVLKEQDESRKEKYKDTLRNIIENQVRHLKLRKTKEQIIRCMKNSIESYSRGKSTSTHGFFSFALDAHTWFIDNETGDLLPLDGPSGYERRFGQAQIDEYDGPRDDKLVALLETYEDNMRILWNMSRDWKTAFKYMNTQALSWSGGLSV